MPFTFLTSLASFLIFLIALLTAITIHEFAHAAMADHLGDPTPRLSGRLTLNPFAHLDPIGTLMLFLFRFGWGKPVPIDPFNLRNPRRDSALISLAGPASNLILAVLLSFILHLAGVVDASTSPSEVSSALFTSVISVTSVSSVLPVLPFFYPLLSLTINLNIILAIFNLLPIHPLDGFKIIHGILPQEQAYQWEELRSLGPLILFLLIFPLFGQSLISSILSPIINWLLQILIPYDLL